MSKNIYYKKGKKWSEEEENKMINLKKIKQ